MIDASLLITGKLPEEVIGYARKEIKNVELYDLSSCKKYSKSKLIELIKGKDAIITLLSDIIDKDVIDSADKLKVISNYAVGYDNIDIDYAKAKGIIVANTPGVLTDATAELAVALLLAAARRIVEADRFVRAGKFKGWQPDLFLGQGLNGKVCGVIGLGRIGQAFVKRLKPFGCEIIYYSRSRKAELEEKLGINYKDLISLLKESDFISLHIPLNRDTYHFLNKERLDLLKKNCIIVNTSRGAIIEESVLIEKLKNREILYAGLDVYEDEPNVKKEMLKLNNTVLTPHIGSATYDTRVKMGRIAVDNVIAVLKGNEPAYRVV